MNGFMFRRGASIGILLSVLIILGQPFYPANGLIPELVKFLTTVPLWITALIFHFGVTPLMQAAVLMVYFFLLGGLLGTAYGIKPLWAWLLFFAFAIHHYEINQRVHLELGEVIPMILSRFGWQ